MNRKEDHDPCSGAMGCLSIANMKALFSFSALEQAADGSKQGWELDDYSFRKEEELFSAQAFQLVEKASSLSEMLTLIELVEAGTITREEAILCTDANYLSKVVEDMVYENTTFSDMLPSQKLLLWSDQVRRLRVFTEGTTPKDVWGGKFKGASGLGLVRCEEMLRAEHLKGIIPSDVSEGDKISEPMQRRLLCLFQEQWESLFYALQGASATISLAPSSSISSYPPDGIQDIQIEALFRAIRACEQQGIDCVVDILVTHPANVEQFAAGIQFIDQIAEQTLGLMRHSIKYKVGVLLSHNTNLFIATELARCTHLMVVDWEWEEQSMSEIFHQIRRIHPSIHIRAVGQITSADLPGIYSLGIDEISCDPHEIIAIRIVATQWELMEKVLEIENRL